jgi:hypothetical protein
MFDNIDFEMICPICGELVGDFQSKDAGCMLDTLSPLHVHNFYSSCHKCRAWIEFNRKPPQIPKSEKKIPLNIILNDFTMEVRKGDEK